MHRSITRQAFTSIPTNLMLAAAALLAFTPAFAQSPSGKTHATKTHHRAKSVAAQPEVAQTPPPPPMPRWPVNDNPNPPSVVWDASGLRINASNSSLQQILNEVSTDTGTKVVGNVPDQRVFGSYGPGNASDVLLQLLQGSGYNVLLAGDLGHGAPSQIVLSPRHGGGPANASNPQPQQQQMQPPDQEDDSVDQPEQPEQPEETVPAIPPPNQPNQNGPNGPMRTPQEIMQEMQQRQLQQQQQMQQQMQQQQQQGNPNPPPQQENPQ